jgi:UDP-glucose 4-epimerase
MTLLVTGGNGFVMSNLVRHWLESDPVERVVVLDSDEPDAMAERFFAPVRDRLQWVRGNIVDHASWAPKLAGLGITRIVHGAAVTPHPFTAADGTRRDPEREDPRRVMLVNLTGAVELLEWARTVPDLRRFVYVSTGSVYGDDGPEDPGLPLPEEGYVDPTTLYGISKYAAELVVRRYGQLFGMPSVSVRLGAVYGPMDRATSSRHVRCTPWLVTHLALIGQELRVAAYDGIGDWIHATDVAEAITRVLRAGSLRHPVYNISYGEPESVASLVAITAEKVPLTAREARRAEANIVCDPDRRHGQWGAYDTSRLRDELGWTPVPLRQRVHEYIDWLRANEFGAAVDGRIQMGESTT